MRKILATLALLLLASAAQAQNYLMDNGIFTSVVTNTTTGQVLQNQSGILGGVSATITVNGAACTLGSSCTPGAGAIAVGDSVTGGTPNGLFYNNANTLGNLATANNGVLVTSAGGVPSISVTLPTGLSAPSFTVTTAFTATGLVTNADLANPATTVNGQTCTLGSTCTVTAAPSGSAGGDLTGTYPNPTLAGVITAGGPTGSATVAPIITYDAKGRLTTVTSATITPAIGSVTGLGTGIATALGTNVGTAGAPVINGGALGSPSSAGTIPAFTLGGTIAGGGNQINNAIIGTTTPLAGFFTTISSKIASANALSAGLNGSTNPAFNVDASTALQVAGLNVKGAVTGGTVAVAVIDSGSNANLTLDAKGTGTIGIGTISTGNVTIGAAGSTTTIGAQLNITTTFNSFGQGSFFAGWRNLGGTASVWFRPDNSLSWSAIYTSNDTILRWTDSAGTADAIDFGTNGILTIKSAYVSAGTKPSLALAGGTCAGTVIAGGAIAGTVTLTGACVITNTMTLSSMPTAPTGYVCDVTDRTTAAAAPRQTSTSTTTAVFTFGGTSGATDVIQYKCIAY